MKTLFHAFVALWLWCGAQAAHAFDLESLQRTLQASPVVRGNFTQTRTLPSLRAPLTSEGTFTVWEGHGVLWRTLEPVQSVLRITPQGLESLQGDRWVAQKSTARLPPWLSKLVSGDLSRLASDFTVTLEGEPAAWRLVLVPQKQVLTQVVQSITVQGGPTLSRVEIADVHAQQTAFTFTRTERASEPEGRERSDFAP